MERKNKLALPLIIIAILIILVVFWGQSFFNIGNGDENEATINEALQVQSDIVNEESGNIDSTITN